MSRSLQNGLSGSRTTKLIAAPRLAFDRNEKETSFGDPLRNIMGKAFSLWSIHAPLDTSARSRKKQQKSGIVSCRGALGQTRPPPTKDPAQVGRVVLNAPRGTTNAQHRTDPSKPTIWPRRAGYIYMRIAPFLEDFAVRRQASLSSARGLYEC